MRTNQYINALIAEAIGTFFLLLFGTGAIIVQHQFPGTVDHLGVSLAFGAIVMVVIFALGSISGAHINPAVTIAFWIVGKFERQKVLPYIFAQIIGATLASLALWLIFPGLDNYGETLPGNRPVMVFLVELLLTFFLMYVIIFVATGPKEEGIMAGLAIGTAVGLCALVGGPLTGASMNPARSIAPALISTHLEGLWIYCTAPPIGAILAVLVWKKTSNKQ